MTPEVDRVNLWIIAGSVLTVLIVVDPPFGFGPLRIVASLVAGALLSLLVSRYYSKRASNELQSEARELRRATERAQEYTDALISFLEQHEVIGEVPRDSQDKPLKPQRVRLGLLRASAQLEEVTEEHGEPSADSQRERED